MKVRNHVFHTAVLRSSQKSVKRGQTTGIPGSEGTLQTPPAFRRKKRKTGKCSGREFRCTGRGDPRNLPELPVQHDAFVILPNHLFFPRRSQDDAFREVGNRQRVFQKRPRRGAVVTDSGEKERFRQRAVELNIQSAQLCQSIERRHGDIGPGIRIERDCPGYPVAETNPFPFLSKLLLQLQREIVQLSGESADTGQFRCRQLLPIFPVIGILCNRSVECPGCEFPDSFRMFQHQAMAVEPDHLRSSGKGD